MLYLLDQNTLKKTQKNLFFFIKKGIFNKQGRSVYEH